MLKQENMMFKIRDFIFSFFANRYYKGPKSDHFDGLRFYNPSAIHKHPFLKNIGWLLTCKRKPFPKEMKKQLSDVPPKHVKGNKLRVSFVGHSTVLIQTQGINIITDPIW